MPYSQGARQRGYFAVIKVDLVAVADTSAGAWIRDALADWSTHTVAAHVPAGFEAYTLVRQARGDDRNPDVDLQARSIVVGILAANTTTPEDCFHAVWDGYGWLHVGSTFVLEAESKPPGARRLRPAPFRARAGWALHRGPQPTTAPNPAQTLPDEAFAAPRFELPNRSYLLLRGALSESLKLGHVVGEYLFTQEPDLLWPADHSWVSVTDTDFDATIIGGSTALQCALLANRELVTQAVDLDVPIAALGITPW